MFNITECTDTLTMSIFYIQILLTEIKWVFMKQQAPYRVIQGQGRQAPDRVIQGRGHDHMLFNLDIICKCLTQKVCIHWTLYRLWSLQTDTHTNRQTDRPKPVCTWSFYQRVQYKILCILFKWLHCFWQHYSWLVSLKNGFMTKMSFLYIITWYRNKYGTHTHPSH